LAVPETRAKGPANSRLAGSVWHGRQQRDRESGAQSFKPPLEKVELLDWQACDYAIEAGYRHAMEKLEQIDLSILSRPCWERSAK